MAYTGNTKRINDRISAFIDFVCFGETEKQEFMEMLAEFGHYARRMCGKDDGEYLAFLRSTLKGYAFVGKNEKNEPVIKSIREEKDE